MNNYIQEYIDSIESENSKKVSKHIFKRINVDNLSIEDSSIIQIERLIFDANPNSIKDITTIIYVLSSYLKYLQEQKIIKNDNTRQIVQSLDKKLLWKKCKPTAKKKFISHEEFERIVKDIATFEEYNALYFELLFSCIYNGIYNDDMSVLKNLRSSDIEDSGMVTLREDNTHIYKIKISERLAKDLKQLAAIDKWNRLNRFGLCQVDMIGIFPDSVFKVESRTTNSENSYKFSYYSKLRKISKDYVGYSLPPLQLYASGIVHRIKIELEKNGVAMEEAFGDNSRNRVAYMIIEKELTRCNSGIELGNFRELIKGHLENF